jgi:hypothetical protein
MRLVRRFLSKEGSAHPAHVEVVEKAKVIDPVREQLRRMLHDAMSKDIDAVISLLVDRIDQNAREIAEKKRTVNSLYREAGKDPLYPEAELTGTAGSRVPAIRASQFYGKTPTIAAREYLDMRRRHNRRNRRPQKGKRKRPTHNFKEVACWPFRVSGTR